MKSLRRLVPGFRLGVLILMICFASNAEASLLTICKKLLGFARSEDTAEVPAVEVDPQSQRKTWWQTAGAPSDLLFDEITDSTEYLLIYRIFVRLPTPEDCEKSSAKEACQEESRQVEARWNRYNNLRSEWKRLEQMLGRLQSFPYDVDWAAWTYVQQQHLLQELQDLLAQSNASESKWKRENAVTTRFRPYWAVEQKGLQKFEEAIRTHGPRIQNLVFSNSSTGLSKQALAYFGSFWEDYLKAVRRHFIFFNLLGAGMPSVPYDNYRRDVNKVVTRYAVYLRTEDLLIFAERNLQLLAARKGSRGGPYHFDDFADQFLDLAESRIAFLDRNDFLAGRYMLADRDPTGPFGGTGPGATESDRRDRIERRVEIFLERSDLHDSGYSADRDSGEPFGRVGPAAADYARVDRLEKQIKAMRDRLATLIANLQ
jgi:hypothetical protein